MRQWRRIDCLLFGRERVLVSINKPAASPRRAGAVLSPGRKSSFRPELQGLRSLAVLMVVTYHIWLGRVSGGVDVFLFISALLMTLQFVSRFEQRHAGGLLSHWLHLFRRLLPAAVTVILATLIASYFLLPRTRLPDIISQSWASLFYVQNFLLQADSVDYYASDRGQASPLQHFWSLSVQGQVFILWPLIFVIAGAAARKFSLRYRALLSYVFGAVFVSSLAYSVAFTSANQGQAYFDSGARLWEFALGTLVALVLSGVRLPRAGRIALGWAGVAAIISCGFVLNVEGSFPGAAALWPTLAAGCVLVAGQTQSRWGVDRILSSAPLVRLGDNSYALYLWHWPVLVLGLAWAGKEQAGWLSGSVIFATSLGLAFLTTRFIEKPLRAWQWPDARRRRAGLAVALTMAVVAVPLAALQIQQHVESQVLLANAERNNPGARALLPGFSDQAGADAALLPLPSQLPQDWAALSGPCTGDLEPRDAAARSACQQNSLSDPAAKKILVLGDSHAQQWLAAIAPVSDENGWRLYAMLMGGCKPSTSAQDDSADCDSFNAAVAAEVSANPPDAIIVVGTAATPSAPGETLIGGFEDTVNSWTEQGIGVLAIRDNPRFDFDMAECVVSKGADAPDCRPRQQDLFAPEPPFAAVEGTIPGLAFLDMTDLLCDGRECPGAVGNTFVYLDNNHLSATYAASLAPMFGERLLEASGWTSG